jgi:hypothetical protein
MMARRSQGDRGQYSGYALVVGCHRLKKGAYVREQYAPKDLKDC